MLFAIYLFQPVPRCLTPFAKKLPLCSVIRETKCLLVRACNQRRRVSLRATLLKNCDGGCGDHITLCRHMDRGSHRVPSHGA
jgi:hypothetical protein